jgi:hypothetical protein
MDDAPALSDLERDLLESASMAGETTTTLDEEMLENSPGRHVVEATLLRGRRCWAGLTGATERHD